MTNHPCERFNTVHAFQIDSRTRDEIGTFLAAEQRGARANKKKIIKNKLIKKMYWPEKQL